MTSQSVHTAVHGRRHRNKTAEDATGEGLKNLSLSRKQREAREAFYPEKQTAGSLGRTSAVALGPPPRPGCTRPPHPPHHCQGDRKKPLSGHNEVKTSGFVEPSAAGSLAPAENAHRPSPLWAACLAGPAPRGAPGVGGLAVLELSSPTSTGLTHRADPRGQGCGYALPQQAAPPGPGPQATPPAWKRPGPEPRLLAQLAARVRPAGPGTHVSGHTPPAGCSKNIF